MAGQPEAGQSQGEAAPPLGCEAVILAGRLRVLCERHPHARGGGVGVEGTVDAVGVVDAVTVNAARMPRP